MGTKTELYKKFMVQKSVLDTLRIYIDITDDFLAKLQQNGILDKDEVMVVKEYGWPSSRNHLLQMLIKKQWDKRMFDGFCGVLKETQKEEKFITAFTRKVDDFMQGHALELAEADGAPKDPIKSLLDGILLGLPLSDQNKIRSMLKEKDDEISKLRGQGEEVGEQLRVVTEENVALKTQLHNLDKAATDLVSSFQYDTEPVTLEDGLRAMRSVLDARQATIVQQQAEQEKLEQQLTELKEWTSSLTTEVIQLKEHKETLEKDLEELKEKYHQEVFDLSIKLEEEQTLTKKLQSRLTAMEKYYTGELRRRDEAMEHLKIELSLANRRLHEAEEEKTGALAELESNTDKTRKLLVSLGLENECKTLGLSLDFARNITYVSKKVPAKVVSNKPQLNPITIDHPQTPKTGRRQSDVTIRPYPETHQSATDKLVRPTRSLGQPIRTGSRQSIEQNTPRKTGYSRNLPPLEDAK